MTRSLPTRSHRGVHRLVATTTLVVAGLGASLAPATASNGQHGPGDAEVPVAGAVCDQDALTKAVDTTGDAARAARRAYTTHTRTQMHTLEVQLRRTEERQARTAATEARKAARDAAKAASTGGQGGDEAKAARDAARAAAAKARTEARQAQQARRANHRQLVALVKAERARLKSQWDAAKVVLRAAVKASDDCEELLADDPTEGDDGTDPGDTDPSSTDPGDTGDSTGSDDGSGAEDQPGDDAGDPNDTSDVA